MFGFIAPRLKVFGWRGLVDIRRDGSRPCEKGPSERYAGQVWIDPLFGPSGPSRNHGQKVTFAPGARTAWHSHPLGQALIVTEGCGWVQSAGGSIEEVRAGDVVWFSPGEKHWHGATATSAMSHITVQECLNGSPVVWLEHVSEAQARRVADRDREAGR